GEVPYEKIQNLYKNANLFIFGSTCENMPNIVVEAMSAGLPILSSHYGPMPEILNDGAIYIDPTDVKDVAMKLEKLLNSVELRKEIAEKAFNYSQNFSWDKTAKKTFEFLKSSSKLDT